MNTTYPCEICDDNQCDEVIEVRTIDTLPPDYPKQEIYVCAACRLSLIFSCSDEEEWLRRCDDNTMWDKRYMKDTNNGTFSFGAPLSSSATFVREKIMKPLINRIITLILDKANDLREGAGYNGSYGDGGASMLEEQVKYYRYGQDGIIPPGWRQYKDQAERESDPEYAEYRRLQKKFQ